MNAAPANLVWADGCLRILDQTALPERVVHLTCRRWIDVVDAIRRLAVRGAPAIGIAGAYGVALAAHDAEVPSAGFSRAVQDLASARPTAADLAQAVTAAAAAAVAAAAAGAEAAAAALRYAETLHREDAARCARIAELGADLLRGGGWVLTHCHTGAVATGGVGTALGAIAEAHRRGAIEGVYACETRPLLQGARLTAWECSTLGIPCRVVVDGAAGTVLSSLRASAVLVGADRIAANGDTANKIGTYPLAVLAERHRVPFYVLAPSSSIDPGLPNGAVIPIEERGPAEVLARPAPGVGVYNPAFDVTPGALISAVVTEAGVFRRPYAFAPGLREATVPCWT